MSTPTTPEGNPKLAEALMDFEPASNMKDHINNKIVELGKAIQQNTFEMNSPIYARKSYTIGALVAYDSEVRRLVSRAGVDLAAFDRAIAVAADSIVSEGNWNNPIGQKLAKTLLSAYQNGEYR